CMRRAASSVVRQREHVERLSASRRLDLGRDQVRHEARASAAEPGRDRDVLLAVDLVADREALHRRREARLPDDAAVAHVDRFELAVEVADEHEAAGRRQRGGQERRALLERPRLLHRVDVEGAEPADVAVAARHLVEAPVRAAGAAAARTLLDGLRADRDAALRERDDHLPRRTVEAHRLPIVAALGARAAVDPLSDLVLDDVLSVARPSGFTVEALPDVLEDRLDMVEVAAVATTELPQNAVLADGEDELVVARVDEHALEHDVEIERF